MIYFVIPAFNEAQNLPRLLSSIDGWRRQRGLEAHVMLVDDGSTDDTSAIARSFEALPLTVASHPRNLGVHRVFQTGFQSVSRFPLGPEDLIVTLEADNTSSLEILDQMLAQTSRGVDLVLASCYAPGGAVIGTTPYRRFLSWCANLILRCIPGMPRVCTFSSFYRVYRASFLSRLLASYPESLIQTDGFVCVVEILLKASRIRARISEVPLRLDGSQRRGKSKMKTIRTIGGYFRLFAWAVLGRLARPIEGADQITPAQPALRSRREPDV